MRKIRTFTRQFPQGNTQAGKPTLFVEKILNGLDVDYSSYSYVETLIKLNNNSLKQGKLELEHLEKFWASLQPTDKVKLHTIRGGKHFNIGDKLSPRVWLKTPYHSPQIIFWNDLEIQHAPMLYIENEIWQLNHKTIDLESTDVAANDGLTNEEIKEWFNNPFFYGQLINWTEDLTY